MGKADLLYSAPSRSRLASFAVASETRRVDLFDALICSRRFYIVSGWLGGLWRQLGDVVDDFFLDYTVSDGKLGQFFDAGEVRLVEDEVS